MSTPAPVQRDRLTLLVYGHLGLWGYFLFAFGPVVPLLRDELDVSNTVAGLHATMIAAGSVTASLLYPWLVRTLGRQAVSRAGMAGLAGGVAVLCSDDRLGLTLAGTYLAGGFGSLLVTGSAVVLTDRHGAAAPGVITEANAVAAALGLIGPALVGAAVALDLGWRPVLLGVVLLAGALALTLGREQVPGAAPSGPASGRLPRHYWPAALVVAVVIGVEASMIVWSSELLRTRSGLGDGGAAAGVSVLLGGMLAGRLAGRRLARGRTPDRLLLGAIAAAAVGFAVFWSAPVAWLALAGLAVMGTGMSLHYPLAIARAIEAASGQAELAAGRAAVGVGLAGALVPVTIGALTDAADIRTAFAVVPVLLLVAALAVLAGRGPIGTLERAPARS